MFSMIWREAHDNAFMVKSDGISLSDMEVQQLELIEIGGTPSEKMQLKDLITEFKDVFRPRYKNHFVKWEPITYKEKANTENAFGQKWERPRRINDPRALAACVEILDGLIATNSIEEIPADRHGVEHPDKYGD